MEKQAIIDEVYKIAYINIDDNADFTIETIKDYDKILDNCPKCNSPLNEEYDRPQTNDSQSVGLVVCRCAKCNRYYAYWIMDEGNSDYSLTSTKGEEHLKGRVIEPKQWNNLGKPQWAEGEPPRFSKKYVEAYRKDTKNQENSINELNKRITAIMQEHQQALLDAGISMVTLNLARKKVNTHCRDKNPKPKILNEMFAAALYLAANENNITELYEHQGEGLSERKTEEIFKVTRKTIREWKKKLEQNKAAN